MRVSFGPWVGGIVRSIARTLLNPQQLWDARGVFFRERGRLHGCFEGLSSYQSSTRGSTWFPYNIGVAPSAVSASTKGQLFYNANHDTIYSTINDDNTSAGDIFGGADDTEQAVGFWYVTASASSGDFVALYNGVGAAPTRVHFWKDAGTNGTLVQLSPFVVPCDNYNESTAPNVVYSWKPSTAVEYQGRLFLFADGHPILVLHPDWYDNASKEGGDPFMDYASFRPQYCMNPDFITSGKPVMIGLSYYNTGTMSATSGANTFTGSGTTWGDPTDTGSPEYLGGGSLSHIIPGTKQSWSSDAIYTRGYMARFHDATTLYTDPADGHDNIDIDFPAGSAYKIVVPGKWAMGRFGEVWKNRLVFVEGREYEYLGTSLSLNPDPAGDGSQIAVNTTSGSPTVTANTSGSPYGTAAFADWFKPGDQILIGTANTRSANVNDYGDPLYFHHWGATRGGDTSTAVNAFDEPYTIAAVDSDTQLTLTSNATATRTNTYFAARRLLTASQRRRIYFAGQPADIANGIAFDPYDWTVVDEDTTVIVGEDSEGDIVRLKAFEDRLLVFMDRAVYEIGGSVPIDPNVLPNDFYVRKISDRGLSSYDALEVSDDGQIVYFCSFDGVYRLYGSTVERIDDVVRDHENYPDRFSHFAWADKRLYMLEADADDATAPADDPYIWIHDTVLGAWSYTKRVNSNGAAPSTSPSETLLYQASGNHGGIFSPFRGDDGQDERILVASDEAGALTGNGIRSLVPLNYGTPPTANTQYHGVKVQTGFVDAGTLEAKRVRFINMVDTNPLATDFDEVQFSVTSSEGPTSLTRNVDPAYSDSDHRKYRVSGTGGRGDTYVSGTVGDGKCPIGEIAGLTMDIDIVEGRND